MNLLSNTFNRLIQPLRSKRDGWVGMEIGLHAIRLSQVTTDHDGYVLSHARTIHNLSHLTRVVPEQSSSKSAIEANRLSSSTNAHSADDAQREQAPHTASLMQKLERFSWREPEDIEAEGIRPCLEEMQRLTPLFTRSSCAATLTDGLIDYREMELPCSDIYEARSMAHSEIVLENECSEDELVSNIWELAAIGRTKQSNTAIAAVSMNRQTSNLIANQLLDAGYECHVMDALPCALVRAIEMMDVGITTPALAIDLGYGQATMTLAVDGVPVITRSLRHCGLKPLLGRIAEVFHLTYFDAEVLVRMGGENENQLMAGLNVTFLNQLCQEIARTLRFVGPRNESRAPKRIILTGPGTRVVKIAEAIEALVQIPTRVWSIPSEHAAIPAADIGLYGVAAALSMLMWEAD